MEVSYRSQRLAKLCSQAKRMVKELGQPCAEKLQQRLSELQAAEKLEDLRRIPAGCHELTADRKGQLAVNLQHPKRLILEPDHDPLPVKPDGGLDWDGITKILVVEIVDYH